MTEPPKRVFRGWIEDWEEPLLKKKDAVAEAKLLQKYKDLIFTDIDEDIVYTIFEGNLEWSRGRNGGWSVLGMPPEYDGENDELLEPYLINDNLIGMIVDTEQPRDLNVRVVAKNEEEASDDDDDN